MFDFEELDEVDGPQDEDDLNNGAQYKMAQEEEKAQDAAEEVEDAIEELEENPHGCEKFRPNRFKPEVCQWCWCRWTQHRGIITDDQIAVCKGEVKPVQVPSPRKPSGARSARASLNLDSNKKTVIPKWGSQSQKLTSTHSKSMVPGVPSTPAIPSKEGQPPANAAPGQSSKSPSASSETHTKKAFAKSHTPFSSYPFSRLEPTAPPEPAERTEGEVHSVTPSEEPVSAQPERASHEAQRLELEEARHFKRIFAEEAEEMKRRIEEARLEQMKAQEVNEALRHQHEETAQERSKETETLHRTHDRLLAKHRAQLEELASLKQARSGEHQTEWREVKNMEARAAAAAQRELLAKTEAEGFNVSLQELREQRESLQWELQSVQRIADCRNNEVEELKAQCEMLKEDGARQVSTSKADNDLMASLSEKEAQLRKELSEQTLESDTIAVQLRSEQEEMEVLQSQIKSKIEAKQEMKSGHASVASIPLSPSSSPSMLGKEPRGVARVQGATNSMRKDSEEVDWFYTDEPHLIQKGPETRNERHVPLMSPRPVRVDEGSLAILQESCGSSTEENGPRSRISTSSFHVSEDFKLEDVEEYQRVASEASSKYATPRQSRVTNLVDFQKCNQTGALDVDDFSKRLCSKESSSNKESSDDDDHTSVYPKPIVQHNQFSVPALHLSTLPCFGRPEHDVMEQNVNPEVVVDSVAHELNQHVSRLSREKQSMEPVSAQRRLAETEKLVEELRTELAQAEAEQRCDVAWSEGDKWLKSVDLPERTPERYRIEPISSVEPSFGCSKLEGPIVQGRIVPSVMPLGRQFMQRWALRQRPAWLESPKATAPD